MSVFFARGQAERTVQHRTMGSKHALSAESVLLYRLCGASNSEHGMMLLVCIELPDRRQERTAVQEALQ